MRTYLAAISLFVVSTAVVACSNATNDNLNDNLQTNAQRSQGECEPAPGYDACRRVSFDEMTSWQKSLETSDGSPEWRTKTEMENGGLKIVLDAREFHEGILRRNPDTGSYESVEDFLKSRNSLLGIENHSNRDQKVFVSQRGETVKIAVDESNETVQKLPSSGNFMMDALTDSNGQISVDGETVYDVDSNTAVSGLGTVKQNVRDDLFGNNWNADLATGKAFLFLGIVNARSKTFDFERNGKSTHVECDFWFLGCDKQYIQADLMHLATNWAANYGGIYACADPQNPNTCEQHIPLPKGNVFNSATNVDAISNRYISTALNQNIEDMCSRHRVCDGGSCNQESLFTQDNGFWAWEEYSLCNR